MSNTIHYDKRGYAYRYEQGKKVYLHREIAQNAGSEIEGMYVIHKDGNIHNNDPSNLLTIGRKYVPANYAKGESHGSARLTWGDVEQIRLSAHSGTPLLHIADRFGVSYTTIWKIVNNITWKDE